MRILVDTSAWLAFYDRSDQHHQSARQIAEQLKAQRASLALSEFILAESLTLIRFRLGHSWAVRFGRTVLDSRLSDLLSVDEPIRRRAWEIFQRYEDKDFSFTDCTSFALMEQLGLKTAFAFDRHFEQYGFDVLKA
jgi:predicted nucleic acid-binding protein